MISNIKAVIIAGGKGTRLSSYTSEIPKPMIKLADKPVLEHQIDILKQNGIKDIIITIGHLKEQITSYFGDGSSFGVNITYIEESQPLGTSGAFYWLKELITDPFFVIYGDIIFDIDIKRFLKFHNSHSGLISLIAHPNSHPHDSNLIECDSNYKVTTIYDKKHNRPEYCANLVNAGAYIMDPEVLNFYTEPKKLDLEKDLVSYFISQQKVFVYKTTEYLKDMGTLDRIHEVEKQIESGIVSSMNLSHKQKCVFLDRDGTINKKNGLVSTLEQMELEEQAAEAIRKLNQAGYLCIVITNQPVIARNLCDFDTLNQIHNKMETLLGHNGAFINDIFICPHHPDSGYPEERKEYKIKCLCRKPGIKLISDAVEKYQIDLSRSFMIGDTTIDIKTGEQAKLHSILVTTGDAGSDKKYNVVPDKICSNLSEAADYILSLQ